MKNYTDNDYAVNKNAKGIVYRFADQTVEVTLVDYLQENPGKTETDFYNLKALSDSDYFEQDRDSYRQTWKNAPFHHLAGNDGCSMPSPEDEVVGRQDQLLKKELQGELAKEVLGKLTEVQRRRYLLHFFNGLTMRQIAEKDEVTHQSVTESITTAEKKIKIFLAGR